MPEVGILRNILVRRFTEEQYKAVKVRAAEEGKSMEAFVKNLVLDAIGEKPEVEEDKHGMYLDPNIPAARVYYLVDAILRQADSACEHMDVMTLPQLKQGEIAKHRQLAETKVRNLKTMAQELFDIVMEDEKE